MPYPPYSHNPSDDPRIEQAENKAAFITYLLEGNRDMSESRYAAAVEHYKKAIQMHPGFYLGYSRIGDAYYRMECYAEATAVYKKSLEINPAQTEVIYRLAKCYRNRNMDIQAEAAFDLAREVDQQGTLRERIDENLENLKLKASRVVHPASLFETIGRSLTFIVTRPRLLLPFFLAYALSILLLLGLNWVHLGNALAQPPVFSLEDRSTFIYYLMLVSLNLLVGVPFIVSAMITVRDLYDGKLDTFADTIRLSYKRLPALISVTALTAMMLGCAAVAVVVAVALLVTPYAPREALPYLPYAPLAVVAAFMPLFCYIYQFIVVDRKSFDDAISASFRLGSQRYIKTAGLLVICGLPFLAIMRFSLSRDIAGLIAIGALRIPLLCFGIVTLTVFFLDATGRAFKRPEAPKQDTGEDAARPKKKSRRKKEESLDEPLAEQAVADASLASELAAVPAHKPPPEPETVPDVAETPVPDPEIPDDLVLEEHVDMPEHLQNIRLFDTGEPESGAGSPEPPRG